ncbi:hypothetical protein Rpal_3023 [Rhodopseudomonas palustris TIE-1]|uniref:hypothetical protein n=1 Tax=Rhodopseudomonas palustris TaxID=1076 RepID=UPI0001779751|nr:hypothetical protein [Rhodopseudomonas palustris]ACF01529.1 hypothetical protein Rpal_3023 [Rhodopseudomonas palustris TIE-1]
MITDERAIEIAEQHAKRHGRPIVNIPPNGAVDEIVTVDLRGIRPVVTRRPPDPIGQYTNRIGKDLANGG